MTWANFYLFCFLVGFFWAVVSLVLGNLHLHFPFLPHGDLHHGGAHVHVHVAPASPHGVHSVTAQAELLSPFNFGSLAAFLAWFGGVGFLLTAYSKLWFVWGLGLSIFSGIIGAAIIFWFLSKVLGVREQELDPMDYEMVGVLGHLSSPIRAGGTGEIVFSQEGTRRTSGARGEDGLPIAKGVEVVVTRYEKGIAYVRPWDELNQTSVDSGEINRN